MRKVLLIYAFSALICGALAIPQVKLGQTTLNGRDVSDKVEFYGGIPFAEPPLGSLRLSKPVLKTRIDAKIFNASAFGKTCTQPDCLTINVYRPTGTSSKRKLPVLFWTHGGAFVVGSSSRVNGTGLVARSISRGTPIIYVSFNYRLGALGFPQGQEADDRRALNLGIHDQTVALQWVQENIHFFGGDKAKVTMAGTSAGAVLTQIQLLNPNTEKSARGAILESGNANTLRTYPAARNELVWQGFVSLVPSCANISTSGSAFGCLQAASAQEIAAAVMVSSSNTDFPWDPTVDFGRGSVLQDYPSQLYAKGKFSRLPFIAGTNLDDGTVFAQSQEVTDPDIKTWILKQHSPPTTSQQALESVTDKLLELYPDDPTVGSPFGTGDELFGLPSSYKRRSALVGDIWFTAPRRQWSQAAARRGVKSYGYLFTQPLGSVQPELGVVHGGEQPYVLGQVPSSDAAGQSLSAAIMDYWISFIVSLNPNDARGVQREWSCPRACH
ncbi:extracellular triacylglycerol lipase precursor [Coprinellus micaceus]|uniref:Extracellular triacylglycerol lipase n=1 Tax=Coprinellus micaceus TaxID=71717 RepID=A0A4Y7TF35_COPMI|nr:extracellular triacylglycerol lipase precursor [Coprinellus micaceus]